MYTPLHEQLLPFLANSWEEIPPHIRTLLAYADPFNHWNELTPYERSYLLSQYDYDFDPSITPTARQRDEALVQQIIENDEEIEKKEKANDLNEVERLNNQYRKLSAELMAPYQSHHPNTPLQKIKRKVGITILAESVAEEILTETGDRPTPRQVMDRLQDMARSDPKPTGTEILIRVSPHGVMWQTPKGVKPSEYDLAACEQTLRRWKRKLYKDIKSS